jgi:hypothetical protein
LLGGAERKLNRCLSHLYIDAASLGLPKRNRCRRWRSISSARNAVPGIVRRLARYGRGRTHAVGGVGHYPISAGGDYALRTFVV